MTTEDYFIDVYSQLRRLAAARMQREPRRRVTLQPTALVHEVYLRLQKEDGAKWHDRAYFFAAAAEAMRRILVEHARNAGRLKRGGNRIRVSLHDDDFQVETALEELLDIDEALSRLEQHDPVMANVVKFRYFSGMTVGEVAQVLDKSPRTIRRLWRAARAWLFQELNSVSTHAHSSAGTAQGYGLAEIWFLIPSY